MSSEGYRTLVVASKALEQRQYEDWAEQYKQACASLDDRAGRVAAVCEQMERDLQLLGATAVEDKLQVGLAHCSCAFQTVKRLVLVGWVFNLHGTSTTHGELAAHTTSMLALYCLLSLMSAPQQGFGQRRGQGCEVC